MADQHFSEGIRSGLGLASGHPRSAPPSIADKFATPLSSRPASPDVGAGSTPAHEESVQDDPAPEEEVEEIESEAVTTWNRFTPVQQALAIHMGLHILGSLSFPVEEASSSRIPENSPSAVGNLPPPATVEDVPGSSVGGDLGDREEDPSRRPSAEIESKGDRQERRSYDNGLQSTGPAALATVAAEAGTRRSESRNHSRERPARHTDSRPRDRPRDRIEVRERQSRERRNRRRYSYSSYSSYLSYRSSSSENPDGLSRLEIQKLDAFRNIVGITSRSGLTSTAPKRRWWYHIKRTIGLTSRRPGERPSQNVGLYRRITSSENSRSLQYYTWVYVINFCYVLQILIGAALTALGAVALVNKNGSPLAITILGGVNTVMAGLLTHLKGQGLPERPRRYRAALTNLIMHIEDREREFLRPGNTLDLETELNLIREMYGEAKINKENNEPDHFVDITETKTQAADIEDLRDVHKERILGPDRGYWDNLDRYRHDLARPPVPPKVHRRVSHRPAQLYNERVRNLDRRRGSRRHDPDYQHHEDYDVDLHVREAQMPRQRQPVQRYDTYQRPAEREVVPEPPQDYYGRERQLQDLERGYEPPAFGRPS